MSKKVYLVVLLALAVCLFAIPSFAADSRLRVAVLPFDDGSIQGQERWWDGNLKVGDGISSELVTALLNTGKFRLIEREQLDKVLAEQNLSASGKIDTSTATKIGRLLGVQILVMGKVTEFTNDSTGGKVKLDDKHKIGLDITAHASRVAIDARMVDTTTAEIRAAVTGRGEKKRANVGVEVDYNKLAIGSDEFKKTALGTALRDAVTSLASQLADKAADITPAAQDVSRPAALSGKVATVYGSSVYLNIGSVNGVGVGMQFKVYHVIRAVKDPSSGKVIDYITEPIANLIVTSVKNNTAVCKVKSRISTKYKVTKNDIVKQN